jgi:hypothetical protein
VVSDPHVFSHGGIVCTGETYKSVVKLTFAKGASLEDPSGKAFAFLVVLKQGELHPKLTSPWLMCT